MSLTNVDIKFSDKNNVKQARVTKENTAPQSRRCERVYVERQVGECYRDIITLSTTGKYPNGINFRKVNKLCYIHTTGQKQQ